MKLCVRGALAMDAKTFLAQCQALPARSDTTPDAREMGNMRDACQMASEKMLSGRLQLADVIRLHDVLERGDARLLRVPPSDRGNLRTTQNSVMRARHAEFLRSPSSVADLAVSTSTLNDNVVHPIVGALASLMSSWAPEAVEYVAKRRLPASVDPVAWTKAADEMMEELGNADPAWLTRNMAMLVSKIWKMRGFDRVLPMRTDEVNDTAQIAQRIFMAEYLQVPPAPEDVRGLVATWLSSVNRLALTADEYTSKVEYAGAAARLVLEMLRIHPFYAANGRLSRVIFAVLLARANIPFASVFASPEYDDAQNETFEVLAHTMRDAVVSAVPSKRANAPNSEWHMPFVRFVRAAVARATGESLDDAPMAARPIVSADEEEAAVRAALARLMAARGTVPRPSANLDAVMAAILRRMGN